MILALPAGISASSWKFLRIISINSSIKKRSREGLPLAGIPSWEWKELTRAVVVLRDTEARSLGCEDLGAYLAHVFTKGLTIGCAKDFKLDVGIRAVFPKLHNSCEASDVSLQRRRKSLVW